MVLPIKGWGFPGRSAVKKLPEVQEIQETKVQILWEGHDNPFQHSCLENLMDGEDWLGQFIGLQRVEHHWRDWALYKMIGLLLAFAQLSHSVMSNSLQPHELQHTRPPCPSPTPGVHPNPRPLSRWCHRNISSCCPLLLLPSIFPSIRVFSNESDLLIRWPKYCNFSFSISPTSEHPGLIFRMDWLDLLAVQGTLKSLLQHHSSKASILWCSAFFIVQLSHPYTTTEKTIALTRRTFVDKVMYLLFNMLSRLVITFLPRSKHLLISWLQSPSAVILEPRKIDSHCFHWLLSLFAMK